MVQPSSKREGFAVVPNVSWDDVGALDAVKEELLLAVLVRGNMQSLCACHLSRFLPCLHSCLSLYGIQAPVRYRELFLDMGLVTCSGILLMGPPGCGKTLLAKVRTVWCRKLPILVWCVLTIVECSGKLAHITQEENPYIKL